MRPEGSALVVVVAGRAIGVAEESHLAALQQLHPGLLGVVGDLHLVGTDLLGVGDHGGDGLAGLGEVVRDVRDQVRTLARAHHEEVGEVADVDAVQAAHAVGPVLRQGEVVASDHVEPPASGVLGAHLEAGGEDEAVEVVVLAGRHDTGLVDALDALSPGVDQVAAGLVVGVEVLVVEAGALAQLAVPGLERLGRGGVAHDGLDPRPDLGHLVVVAVLVGAPHGLRAQLVALADAGDDAVTDALGDVGPAVLHEVLVGEATGLQGGEVHQPPGLPTGLEVVEPVRVDGLVVADVDRRRGALEHVELTRGPRQVRDALHRGGAGADDADALVGELLHERTAGVAAGVVVVPPAGVEGVPAEALDAGDAGQLRPVQRPGPDGDELGADLVAAVGADDPARRVVVPAQLGDPGREAGVVVEPEVPGDALAVLEDLGRLGVLLRRAGSRSPRAAAGRSWPRCRTSHPGSGSSTRPRRRRRPSR